VSVPLTRLKELHPQLDPGNVEVIDGAGGAVLVSQGENGELLFQGDFRANEAREFTIRPVAGNPDRAVSRVDGRFVPPREDYAWENDRIAFRMYGPALASEVNNGIDVWTKRVRYLIVEKWYRSSAESGKDTYHEDHGEGADFFSVGRTLGAGSSGLWYGGNVLQPGVFSSWRTICNGPIRVCFELTYATWNVGGKKFTERKRISLDAGQNLNRIEVTFTGDLPADTLEIACGLVKRGGTDFVKNLQRSWMGLWGATTSDTTCGSLGTGVVIPSGSSSRFDEEKDQHVAIVRVKGGMTFVYHAGAGWTGSGDFRTKGDWFKYLGEMAARIAAPLRVEFR
jgi:pectinesterase